VTIITIAVALLAALAMVLYFIYRLTIASELARYQNQLLYDDDVAVTTPEQTPTILTAQQIESQAALRMADAILRQIESLTDDRGFYGWRQLCARESLGQYRCELDL
jgi:hypothetical protein